MKGGAPRVVWLTLGADPYLISALSAAQRLNQLGRPCHLVWNPSTGESVQLIPVIRAACSLGLADSLSREGQSGSSAGPLAVAPLPDECGGVNTEGRLCVQIGVVAFGWEPFTAGPVRGLAGILDWLDSWGVARRWPAGPPAAFAHAPNVPRSRKLWARGGHYGASQVPGCAAAGPGAIDVEMLTGRPAAPAPSVPVACPGQVPVRTRPAALSPLDAVRPQDEPAEALARAG